MAGDSGLQQYYQYNGSVIQTGAGTGADLTDFLAACVSSEVSFSIENTSPTNHKMYRYKVGEEGTAAFLTGLTST